MPSISELEALKPQPGQYSSPAMYQQDLAYWEEQIVPILRSLQTLTRREPSRDRFTSEDDFEEARGYWMGRMGRVIALPLSTAFARWERRPRDLLP